MQTLHFQCCYLCNRHKFRELKDTQQEVCAGQRTFRYVFCVDIQYGGRVVFFNEAHGGLKSVKMCNFFLLCKENSFKSIGFKL